MSERVGHVAIGRNEGARLVACLASLIRAGGPIVYVDSGSTDDSVAEARRVGAHVVALDMSQPFTAARARNAGLKRLASVAPDIDYVQFIDGDCEMEEGWIKSAAPFLDTHPNVAAVAGRLKEKRPEASLYNRLCDAEWDAPPGETEACGGVALMRRHAVEAVGGFRESLIAGEEPELCVRLRERDFRIFRLDAPMARHDAAMTRLSQWWRRAKRGGFAFAEVSSLHRRSPKRIWAREAMRPLLWTAIGPLCLVASLVISPLAAAGLLIYPAKIAAGARRLKARPALSPLTQSLFHMLAKFAEAQGVAQYALVRLRGARAEIIEYKDAA